MATFYLEILFDLPLNQSWFYTLPEDIAPERGGYAGRRVRAPFGRRELTGYVVAERVEPPAGLDLAKIKAVKRFIDKEPLFGPEEVENALWISDYYFCAAGEALSAMIPSGRRDGGFSAFTDDDFDANARQSVLELSDEQENALKTIVRALPQAAATKPETKTGGIFYLFGITGSGKTEVFLRAAEAALEKGGAVIYLVPEIALTQQTAEALGQRFGAKAAVLHSGMSGSERLSEWMRIRRGEARIVLGPRSAVFAPIRNPALIIIDEEHDGSYMNGSTPRYHARQMAMRRCARTGAALVMGSATPSLEAWKLMNEGRITRLTLTRRLAGGTLPEIKIVSLEGTAGCLTRELKNEIRRCADDKRQTILFLNRRGFAYFYHCPICGCELTCKRCSVSLTWHKAKGYAECHYCGYRVRPPAACPKCGSLEAGFSGFGTEMIEEELKANFPDLSVRRLDADTAAKGNTLETTLTEFRAGFIDILLGTQMVAKGLNFPGVRLVGVVFADIGLHLPDFRAAERTFSLLVQVAGRSGRFFPDGKVIVQTLRPGDRAIVKAAALDMDGFFAEELTARRELGFPPYSRLIRWVIRSSNESLAAAEITRLYRCAAALLPPNADILGPAECPISMLNGKHRRHIILRGEKASTLHAAARIALANFTPGLPSNAYLETDIDPVSLL
ncbi:MAG: primosomal protein N' [Spirochaetaceae bacterium]|nr:primosomal protein N' [Spirochaetaceae bacterium]